jgi:hypothetical protein
MRNVGKLEEFPILQAIVESIFAKTAVVIKRSDIKEPIRTRFNNRKDLWYVDHQGVRYVEQNPKTNSGYALRSRPPEEGGTNAKIVQVYQGGEYLGCIEDGEVFMKSKTYNAYQK